MRCKLSDLKKGEEGEIERFDVSDETVKFMEMGFLPGEKVKVETIAPLGDPMAVLVAGYRLSLRKSEACRIWVNVTISNATHAVTVK